MVDNSTAAQYYDEPTEITLRFVEIVRDPFPEPQEAEVTFQINGHQETAFVPLRNVDSDSWQVKASIIGEHQNNLLVSFPPTNFGKTTFSADRHDLLEITVG
jgi:hypothetical protein